MVIKLMSILVFPLLIVAIPLAVLIAFFVFARIVLRRSDTPFVLEHDKEPIYTGKLANLYGLPIRLTFYQDFFVYYGEVFYYAFVNKITVQQFKNFGVQILIQSTEPNPKLVCIHSSYPDVLNKYFEMIGKVNPRIQIDQIGVLGKNWTQNS